MADNELALGDIRVLDISEGVSGPFCAKLLAGLGAEVIKVERPGSGDSSRMAQPFLNDEPHKEKSALFLYLNTGKKSVTLNLESQKGASILRRLAQECDILVESFPARYMGQIGLGYDSLSELNPELIYTSITPFGQTGPYRDYKGSDIVIQAIGALMHTIGLPDREPLKIGGNVVLYTVGISAFSGVMLALHVRDNEGHGQHVDISAMEAITVAQIHSSIHHQFGRATERRESALVKAKDGWVSPGLEIGVQEDVWAKVCELMGVPDLTDDPAFNSREARREHQQDLLSIVGEWAATRTKEEVYHALQGMRTISGYVATVEDLFKSEQFLFREFFQPIDHPFAGEAMYPGAPINIEGETWQQSRAPLLGEHNDEVFHDQLGFSAEEMTKLSSKGVI